MIKDIIDEYACIETGPMCDEAWYNYKTRKLYCFTEEDMEKMIGEIEDIINDFIDAVAVTTPTKLKSFDPELFKNLRK